MPTFTHTVTIECETADEAERVIGERLGFDRDYGFAYTLQFEHARRDGDDICGTLSMRPSAPDSPPATQSDAQRFAAIPIGVTFYDPSSGESYIKTTPMAAIPARPSDPTTEGEESPFAGDDMVHVEANDPDAGDEVPPATQSDAGAKFVVCVSALVTGEYTVTAADEDEAFDLAAERFLADRVDRCDVRNREQDVRPA